MIHFVQLKASLTEGDQTVGDAGEEGRDLIKYYVIKLEGLD